MSDEILLSRSPNISHPSRASLRLQVAIAAACILSLCLPGLVLLPESPQWLLRKGRDQEAKEALYKLRRDKQEVLDEIRAAKQSPPALGVQERLTRANVFAMTDSTLLMFLKETSGQAALQIYIIIIFQLSGFDMDPAWCSILVTSMKLLCAMAACAFVSRFRRKLAVSVGTVVAVGALCSIGGFFYLKDSLGMDVSSFDWFPLLALTLFMMGFAGAECEWNWEYS